MIGRTNAKRFFGQQGIVTDGLKLWLDASNPVSYPGSGNTWYDLSGNNNNATLVNGVAYSAVSGGMMNFDGVNDYATLGNVLNIGLDDFSYAFYSDLKQANLKGLFGKTIYGDVTGRWGVYTEGGVIVCYARGITTSNIVISAAPYLNNGVHYFEVTISRLGQMKLYIDRVLVGSTNCINPTFNATTNGHLFIGAYGDVRGLLPQAGMYNNVTFNDAYVYSRLLTDDERTRNFNATKSKYGL